MEATRIIIFYFGNINIRREKVCLRSLILTFQRKMMSLIKLQGLVLLGRGREKLVTPLHMASHVQLLLRLQLATRGLANPSWW